jgi:polyisoprenoid-binding protein YceI
MTKWIADTTHSEIGFTARHMLVAKVRGSFEKFAVTAELPDHGFEAGSVEVKIDAASVSTREDKRDAHLRSADFFDVERTPEIAFRSRRVAPKGAERFDVVGDLTIRGVTREVVLAAEFLGAGKDPWGNERRAFSGEAVVNRHDFGLDWNAALEAGGVLVGPEVKIHVDVQLVRA